MTNITQHTAGSDLSHIPIGAKLQTAREFMRLDRKDAAAQLRLNESVIDMIENNTFPVTMPHIFIRGYIRSYGKLLQISDADIQSGLEPMQPVQLVQTTTQIAQIEPQNNRKYLMQGLTTGIALTLLWLVAVWWHGHSAMPALDNVAVNVTAEPSETVMTAATPAGISVQLKPSSPIVNSPAPLKAVSANATTRLDNTENDAGNKYNNNDE